MKEKIRIMIKKSERSMSKKKKRKKKFINKPQFLVLQLTLSEIQMKWALVKSSDMHNIIIMLRSVLR